MFGRVLWLCGGHVAVVLCLSGGDVIVVCRQMNETGQCSQCNRAIMLITDGAPETHEDIFKTYNWPEKNVSNEPNVDSYRDIKNNNFMFT